MAAAVREHVASIRQRFPLVRRVYWYGSYSAGIPTPRSDVDLCIVLAHDARRPRDRLLDFLPDRFPVGIDLCVVTEEELAALAQSAPGWHRAIVSGRQM